MFSFGNQQCPKSGVSGCFYDCLISPGTSLRGGGASFGYKERLGCLGGDLIATFFFFIDELSRNPPFVSGALLTHAAHLDCWRISVFLRRIQKNPGRAPQGPQT